MQGLGAIEWVFLANHGVQVGDAISADAGGLPIYRVVAIDKGQAWVRGEDDATVRVMPVACFSWKAASVSR
jgi:hypothetical protein